MITVDPAPGRGTRTESGTMQIPNAQGLGVAPDADWLGDPIAKYTEA